MLQSFPTDGEDIDEDAFVASITSEIRNMMKQPPQLEGEGAFAATLLESPAPGLSLTPLSSPSPSPEVASMTPSAAYRGGSPWQPQQQPRTPSQAVSGSGSGRHRASPGAGLRASPAAAAAAGVDPLDFADSYLSNRRASQPELTNQPFQ